MELAKKCIIELSLEFCVDMFVNETDTLVQVNPLPPVVQITMYILFAHVRNYEILIIDRFNSWCSMVVGSTSGMDTTR